MAVTMEMGKTTWESDTLPEISVANTGDQSTGTVPEASIALDALNNLLSVMGGTNVGEATQRATGEHSTAAVPGFQSGM